MVNIAPSVIGEVVQRRHALARQPETPSVLGSLGDGQCQTPGKGRHGQLAAKDRIVQGSFHFHVEVFPLPAELGVVFYRHHQVEIVSLGSVG